MPINCANFHLKFNLVFEPHLKTNGKPACYIYISREVIVALVFFRTVVSVVSLEQKKKKKLRGLSICWLVHDKHRVKNHVQIGNIERGMANLPLCYHLGWPSS